MDIIDVMMCRIGRYDTRIDAMFGVWQVLSADNRHHFSSVISRYMDEALESMLSDGPYEQAELTEKFPELTDTLKVLSLANSAHPMLGIEMIAFTIGLTQTSWGMAPWEGLIKAIRQYENYHLEV